MQLIAIAGGIGAGKSTVSLILKCLGYPVYDCDNRAREIINTSDSIRQQILSNISSEAYNVDGTLNRELVAKIVFNDTEKLKALNSITHQAVKDDLMAWAQVQNCECGFVESAIVQESGLDRIVDAIWEVTAPEELRIKRVMARSGLSAEQVANRIAAQAKTIESAQKPYFAIVNDNRHSLLLQVNALLAGNHLNLD